MTQVISPAYCKPASLRLGAAAAGWSARWSHETFRRNLSGVVARRKADENIGVNGAHGDL
jgi:hypothetical protein